MVWIKLLLKRTYETNTKPTELRQERRTMKIPLFNNDLETFLRAGFQLEHAEVEEAQG